MKYCSQCGSSVPDGAKFCNSCGTVQDERTVAVQPADPFAPQIHCPKCKSPRLTPITETEIQGGYAVHGAVTNRVGASAMDFKNIHRTYWMCQTCGHKFRNIENLEEELAVQKKGLRSGLIFVCTCIAWLLYTLFSGFGIVLALLCTLLIVPIFFVIRTKVKKLEAEKKYLEENCRT